MNVLQVVLSLILRARPAAANAVLHMFGACVSAQTLSQRVKVCATGPSLILNHTLVSLANVPVRLEVTYDNLDLKYKDVNNLKCLQFFVQFIKFPKNFNFFS